MADLVQTAANVGIGSLTALTRIVQVGEAVTQGQPGYRLASDGKYYQTDADVEASADVQCIFLTPAATDGYALALLKPQVASVSNLVNLGATLTVGTMYYVSPTKGAICLATDLLTNDYVSPIGVAKTTALLDFQPQTTGVQVP